MTYLITLVIKNRSIMTQALIYRTPTVKTALITPQVTLSTALMLTTFVMIKV